MLTREQMYAELRRLSPADLAKVITMARVIRAAKETGDGRPALVLVAPTLAIFARKTTH